MWLCQNNLHAVTLTNCHGLEKHSPELVTTSSVYPCCSLLRDAHRGENVLFSACKMMSSHVLLRIREFRHTDMVPFALENSWKGGSSVPISNYNAQRCPQLSSWYHWTSCTDYGSFQRLITAKPNGLSLATVPEGAAALLIQQSTL